MKLALYIFIYVLFLDITYIYKFRPKGEAQRIMYQIRVTALGCVLCQFRWVRGVTFFSSSFPSWIYGNRATIKSNYLSKLRRRGALNAFFTLDIWLGAHFCRLRRRLRCCRCGSLLFVLQLATTLRLSLRRATKCCTHTQKQAHRLAGVLLILRTLYLTPKCIYTTYIVAIVSDVYIVFLCCLVLGRKCIFNDIFSWHVTSLSAVAAPHESFARTRELANFHFSF